MRIGPTTFHCLEFHQQHDSRTTATSILSFWGKLELGKVHQETPSWERTDSCVEEELSREFARSVFSAPGVHAFLFVVPFGRFTEQEEDILKQVKEVFGKNVLKHVILLFTYGDECIRERIQAAIDGNSLVSKVIQSCQGYHVLNNRDLTDRQQVRGLLQKIDMMTERNQGYYTNEMYEWTQKTSWETFWEILKDFIYAVIAFFQNLSKSFDNSQWRKILAPYTRL